MKEISQIDPGALAGVSGLLSDIDDTLSSGGKLTSEAFDGLWRLHDAGMKVIVVTGRPGGWCDHIARFWPVDAVVGENGGFYFYHDGDKLQKRYVYNDQQRREFRERLVGLRDKILKEVPGAGIASDQAYREYDLAIDFCEDVEPLGREQVIKIKEIFEQGGANAKISSIHVNGWFGEFDKLSTARLCLRELYGTDLDNENNSFVYCGDSPNDEPMFDFFQWSFGMANIKEFLPLMRSYPAVITSKPSGAGFCEVVELLLQNQKE